MAAKIDYACNDANHICHPYAVAVADTAAHEGSTNNVLHSSSYTELCLYTIMIMISVLVQISTESAQTTL